MIFKRIIISILQITLIMFENTLIIDFETSGLNPYYDEIIEIAAKKLREDDSYTTLIKHKRSLDKKIVEITKITNRNSIYISYI